MELWFNRTEMDTLDQWAIERGSVHDGNPTLRSRRHSSDEVNRLGLAMEYAVWREVGGIWFRHLPSGKDEGVDIRVQSPVGSAVNLGIRGNFSVEDPWLYLRDGEEFVADLMILGVPIKDGVRLVGAAGRYFFNAEAGPGPRDWPHPVERALPASRLFPVKAVLEWLREFRRDGPQEMVS